MKTEYSFAVLFCILVSLSGCDRGEKLATQSRISSLEKQIAGAQIQNDGLSRSNLALQGTISELQEKIKSTEEINVVLKEQLASVNLELRKTIEAAQTNKRQEKIKPIEEAIRAFRKFNSIISVSITFDEYRQKLQELKVALDENSSEIEKFGFSNQFQGAYADYQDALVVWGASLGQNLGNYEAALKKHGEWSSQIPEMQAAYWEGHGGDTNTPSELEVSPLSAYNYSILKYKVSPCLDACSSSAKNLIDDVEQKVRDQNMQD